MTPGCVTFQAIDTLHMIVARPSLTNRPAATRSPPDTEFAQ